MSVPSRPPLVAVTAGEPAGIGPDLCVLLAQRRLPARVVIIADAALLHDRARALGISRRALYRLIGKHGLVGRDPGPAAPVPPPA